MRQSYIFLICLSLFTSCLQATKPQNIDVSLGSYTNYSHHKNFSPIRADPTPKFSPSTHKVKKKMGFMDLKSYILQKRASWFPNILKNENIRKQFMQDLIRGSIQLDYRTSQALIDIYFPKSESEYSPIDKCAPETDKAELTPYVLQEMASWTPSILEDDNFRKDFMTYLSRGSIQLNDITSSALIDIYYPEFDYSSIDTSSSESESELPVLVHMF